MEYPDAMSVRENMTWQKGYMLYIALMSPQVLLYGHSIPGGLWACFSTFGKHWSRLDILLFFASSITCVWHCTTLGRSAVRYEECNILLLLHTDSKIAGTFITPFFFLTSSELVKLIIFNESFLTTKNLCGPNCHTSESCYSEFSFK